MKGVVKGKMTRQVYARLQDHAKWCRNSFADLFLTEGGLLPHHPQIVFFKKCFFPKSIFNRDLGHTPRTSILQNTHLSAESSIWSIWCTLHNILFMLSFTHISQIVSSIILKQKTRAGYQYHHKQVCNFAGSTIFFIIKASQKVKSKACSSSA